MEELLPFYERELGFLRSHSQEFARRYPKIAARLAMSSDNSEDPHVERLIQSFALLTARISKKLDDDYPEFTEALIDVLYPHYLRPFPACSIVQFSSDGTVAQLTKPIVIPRGTSLKARDMQGVTCIFRTAYDVSLAPIQVSDVVFHSVVSAPTRVLLPKDATASLSTSFETIGDHPSLMALGLGRVRVFIDAEPSLSMALIDAIHLKTAALYVEPDRCGKWTPLGTDALHQVGYDEREALIELPARAHPAYRLLSEYFAFPEKFSFVDFDLDAALAVAGACRTLTFHVVMRRLPADSPSSRLLEGVTSRNLRLGCTPVINLFRRPGDPIRMSHAKSSYPVLPESRNTSAYEIYSIDTVHMSRQGAVGGNALIEFKPFYSLHHGDEPSGGEHYWYTRRNEAVAELSPGYETEISIVDSDLEPTADQVDTLSFSLTCSNRDLPHSMAIGLPGGDLFMEFNSMASSIRMLRRPTLTQRVPRGRARQWRLISHLSLNHLSLVSSGLSALKEMLRLYDLSRSAVSNRQIEALLAIDQRPATQWLPGKPFATFVRGIELRLTVDEAGFVGSSLHEFARVMDRFFGLYVHLNSFTQLTIVSARDNEELVRCKPRSGDSILL